MKSQSDKKRLDSEHDLHLLFFFMFLFFRGFVIKFKVALDSAGAG